MVKGTSALVLMLGFAAGCAEAAPLAEAGPNPDPLETIPFPSQQPKAKDEFSLTDRAQGERYLNRLHLRFQEIARERNPVVQEEMLAELKKTLGEIDGKVVTWEYPTRFSQTRRAIELALPPSNRPGPAQIATTNYGDYLLPDLTALRLRLDRELDRDSFRKLKGGETVKFKAVLNTAVTQFGLSFNFVGRIVEDPFGKAVSYGDAFQAKSTWAGQCVAGRNKNSLKIKVTGRTRDSFTGTCTELRGSRVYAVTGKIDGDKVELTVHRGNDREQFPFFTTFRGTITDGFLAKGTFDKGTFLFSLHDDEQ